MLLQETGSIAMHITPSSAPNQIEQRRRPYATSSLQRIRRIRMSRVRGCPNVYWQNVMCTASTQNLAVLSGPHVA
jgi:hypothetical protein